QGASTITQQVARNFLLTNEKTYERKIREIILSGRVEETFDKEHILYLYLNQIYLGSGAYGIEAASRTYYGKPAYQMSLAEAAILAGLPQRPSDYSPHNNWDKARGRQKYVLRQMLQKGYIDQAEHDAALAESVHIAQPTNEFLEQAPYFTEHIRRYLVETYGFEKVYNDGLVVEATTDLELQKAAQTAVSENVTTADNRRGWRGPLEQLDEGRIEGWLKDQEDALRQGASQAALIVGPEAVGGYGPKPDRSALEVDRRYKAAVLEVTGKHIIAGVGSHKVIIPGSWTRWAYSPERWGSSYRRGDSQNDMTKVVKRGDVIEVEIEHLDAEEADNLKGYGPAKGLVGAKLYQAPELQGAMFSYRLSDGAVLAMVGGVDFADSEYNRATQARRQVGSTFKPIVYAAAIESKKFTTGTLIQDAPLIYRVLNDKRWTPGNYGGESSYEGFITLRRALQLSKNVCTIRVLDELGLDAVYDLAGPTLRIGYNEPACARTHIPAAATCEGTRTPSNVSGMVWCEVCDPTSCPVVEAERPLTWRAGQQVQMGDKKTCLDEPFTASGKKWCHSCDVNLRVCDWLPISEIPSKEPCIDARKDEKGQVWCRTCDLSMGLGSSSLTMVELARAYSTFATYGSLVEPHFIERVKDRDGTVIEEYKPPTRWPEVMDPSVAGIAHWLLRQVATGGTGARTNRLGIHVAGKTGTTNDFFDAWFVGYNTEMITAAWVGFDTPATIGSGFTGGRTALPIWMDYMRVAAPKEADKDFPPIPDVDMVAIDESTGKVARGGRVMPMLRGTAPTNIVGEVGQKDAESLMTDF
ncbi:MAG: transglycosylase domain-containing protein, partial [Myxococcota bacterium]